MLGSKTAVTTNEGRFEFEDLAAGTYTVEISVDGYNPFETQVNINQNLTGQKFELITNGPVVNINALEESPMDSSCQWPLENPHFWPRNFLTLRL